MTILNSIHHINFVVADIDAAVESYQSMLGLGPFEYAEHLERSVRTARVLIGGVWLVLVSPWDEKSEVGRHLKNHGEGFLLMSFGVNDLDQALVELVQRGAVPADRKSRAGILGWQVADLETQGNLGIRFHLTQTD